MSDTNKTAPSHVQMMVSPARCAVPIHCCEHGACQLPTLAKNIWNSTTCHWEGSEYFWNVVFRGCGCELCSAQFRRHKIRRASRRRRHVLLRRLALAEADSEAFEALELRISANGLRGGRFS